MANNMDKKAVRKELLNRRREKTKEEVEILSKKISDHILQSRLFKEAKVIMAFLAFGKEPFLDLVLQQAFLGGKIICVPYVYGEGLMKPCKLSSLNMVELDQYGIRRPKAPYVFIESKDIDLVLVSGVGFTLKGERLGMGAGFYDRFLPKVSEAKTMGVTYESQVVDMLPLEKNDVGVAFLVTEEGVRLCKKNK